MLMIGLVSLARVGRWLELTALGRRGELPLNKHRSGDQQQKKIGSNTGGTIHSRTLNLEVFDI
jgi:hypothetical protein